MSILMCRARRESKGKSSSNIRWNYGHNTVPRHHRDVFVTEYGIAATRGCGDSETIDRLLHVADAEFHDELIDSARRSRKIESSYALADDAKLNRPDVIKSVFDNYRDDFPPYPLGTDLTGDEQALVEALEWLQSNTSTKKKKMKTLLRALTAKDSNENAIARMDLANPTGLGQIVMQRMLKLALQRTRQ